MDTSLMFLWKSRSIPATSDVNQSAVGEYQCLFLKYACLWFRHPMSGHARAVSPTKRLPARRKKLHKMAKSFWQLPVSSVSDQWWRPCGRGWRYLSENPWAVRQAGRRSFEKKKKKKKPYRPSSVEDINKKKNTSYRPNKIISGVPETRLFFWSALSDNRVINRWSVVDKH